MKRWRLICVGFVRQFITVLAATVIALAGCETAEDPLHPPLDPPVVKGMPLLPLERTAGKENPRDYFLMVRLTLITVRVPVGAVSDSEQLWSYLDEEPVGARIGSALAHNGIRVGLGQKDAWGDVAAVLRKLTGQSLARSTTLAPPGSPIPIVFKPDQQVQTIFAYRRDHSLFGRDYPPGDNVVMVTATINYDDPSLVHLTAAPAVRATGRRRRYIKRSDRYAIVSEQIYHRLGDLDFQFKVPRGGFLLIGPGQEVRRPSSPGRHFLIHRKRGLEFETVVVIAPEVFAAPLKRSD